MAYRSGQNNYGTSLQGYALLKTLLRLGYDVEIINYVKQLSLKDKIEWIINLCRCGMLKNILTSKFKQKLPPEYIKNIDKRTAAVNHYKEKNLVPRFKTYIGYENLHKGSNNYDAVIVGSDQVWIPAGLTSKFYNLLFVADSVRKVAYASSFGVAEIPEFQKRQTGLYLDRFYRIGVREQQGKEIVESLSHKKAKVVADPTLLLTKEEWELEIATSHPIEPKRYIFCYLISENKEARNKATQLARKKDLEIVCIRHLEKYRAIDETYGDFAPYEVDPNDFIKYIKDAAYVCTDSFHCTVFSHIFHKQFTTFYRTSSVKNNRNSRIDSLFEILGTDKNHLYDIGGLDGIDVPINWNTVDANLSKLRSDSINFLKESLL